MLPQLSDRRWWFDVIALSLLFWAVAYAGFRIAPAYAHVTSIWFPSGIALAVLLLRGIDRWPGALFGAMLFTLSIGVPLHLSFLSGSGDMLSSLVGCWLLNRYGFDPKLTSFRDALLLIFAGAALPTLFGGSIGATTLVLGGVAPVNMWPLIFKVWWLADFGGVLTLTPLLLALARPQKPWQEPGTEALLLACMLLISCGLAFGLATEVFHGNPIPAYLVFPFVIWAAVRFGHAATALVVLVASLSAIGGSIIHLSTADAVRSLQVLNLQMFMSVVSGVGLVLVAATAQQRQVAALLVSDIAKREQVEEALRQSEAGYRALFEHAAVGIAHVGLDGHYVRVNQRLCQLFGYSEQEMLQTGVPALTHPDDMPATNRAVQQMLSSEVTIAEDDKRYLCKDGSYLWAHTSVGLHRAQDGTPLHFVTVVQDISQQKAAEEALKLHQEHLEELVTVRTQELASFSYSVSHDLRAPLRLIDGMSMFLLEDYNDRLDDTGRDYLQRIRRGVHKMSDLIDALLALAQISRAELHAVPVDLSALAQELGQELRQLHPQQQVEFVVAPNLRARGDALLLRAALQNLLGNAWKFSRKVETPHIEVGALRQDGETVYFVRDNGAGFNMANADRLFGAFQRLHSEQEFEGSGIGLASVARIIHRHEGRIWAESAPGAGATFYFTLPR
ncbi:MASE1 domain-containing protein [Chitinimonas lacunae]|uniref:histidine kinase n=1 Tax=Chitinimonas lacunae TaxID=1963018 RepID=A0ABV8MN08_9NEIS